jgi:hypothetical protein
MTDIVRVALITATPPTIVALGALAASLSNYRKIAELHVIVNSRLSELLKVTGKASFAEGKAEGKAEHTK